MTLHYTLKKQWFIMTKAKIKREEYREIKGYWISRLTNTPKDSIWNYNWVIDNPECIRTDFTEAFIRNGYSKDATTHTEQIESITIGTGKPEWGAEPGKLYFVIKYKD